MSSPTDDSNHILNPYPGKFDLYTVLKIELIQFIGSGIGSGPVFTNHSQEKPLSFSQRFSKFEYKTTSD